MHISALQIPWVSLEAIQAVDIGFGRCGIANLAILQLGKVIEDVQREQGCRIVGVESAVTALIERIAELERDNRKLRGTVSVKGQRVDRLQRGMSRMQRELRQIRRLRFYDRVRVAKLEACARKHMGYLP
ncbi:hypothetical protein Tco_0098010 [Tanacetum coccineum]